MSFNGNTAYIVVGAALLLGVGGYALNSYSGSTAENRVVSGLSQSGGTRRKNNKNNKSKRR